MLERVLGRLAHGKGFRVIGTAVALLVMSTGLTAGLANPASAAVCSRVSQTVSDVGSHGYEHTWTTVSYCGNDYGAPIYAVSNTNTRVATMYSTTSWFVCYVHGAYHAGNNDVWYYTQGDSIVSRPEYHGWGFMPAANVHTTNDPGDSQLPACPWPTL